MTHAQYGVGNLNYCWGKMDIAVSLKLSLHLESLPLPVTFLCSECFCRHCRADLMVRHNPRWLFFFPQPSETSPLTSAIVVGLSPQQYSYAAIRTSWACGKPTWTRCLLLMHCTNTDQVLCVRTAFIFGLHPWCQTKCGSQSNRFLFACIQLYFFQCGKTGTYLTWDMSDCSSGL